MILNRKATECDLSVSVLSSIVKVLEKQSIKYVVVGDVLGIVKTSGKKLDQSYLENWAETLELSDLLAELFLEAKPED